MAKSEQPLGPRRLDFSLLSDEDFELLCYLIVAIDFPDAVPLRAPDGGADTALPSGSARAYERCWQAKRFTGHIRWSQCSDSLDAAVARYGMSHYTFCFARDLTGNQETIFGQRLVGRHDGVTVDYWPASRLTSALLASAQGERIANHFYGDPSQNARALMQALRAGGALETGADAADRLVAVADWLAGHDPFFAYPASVREAHLPSPGPTPGAVIAFEEIGPEVANRFEAVPRSAEAMEQFGPRFSLLFRSTEEGQGALAALQRSMETGQEVTLEEGVSLRFDQLPPLLQSRIPNEPLEGMSITIGRSDARPSGWPARVIATSDQGEAMLDLDLEPVQALTGWDASFEGSYGGITVALHVRRVGDAGAAGFTFSFSYDSTLPVTDLLAATSMLGALHGRGTLEIRARNGERPSLRFDFEPQPLPQIFSALHGLLVDLREIEKRAGTTLALPHTIEQNEISAIGEVGYILRNGKSSMNFEHITLVVGDEQRAAFERGTHGPVRMVLPLRVNLFGEEMMLGHLVGAIIADDISVAEVEQVEDASPPAWSVRLEPASEAARSQTFEFQIEEPEFAAAAREE